MRPGEGQKRDIDRDERRAVEKALRATGPVRSILDLGVGNGRWLPLLADKKAGLLTAIDISRDQLSEAQSHAAAEPPLDVSMVCGDMGALPFAAQSFDLVVCLAIMPYVRQRYRLRALREMRRVSSRWVVVQYAHIEGLSFAAQRVRERVGLEALYPKNHLSNAEIESEIRRAGLGIRGFARVGGAFSRSSIVLAEAPSPDWMKG